MPTQDNRSDLGTKYLDRGRIDRLMEMSSLRPLTKGLAAVATLGGLPVDIAVVIASVLAALM